MITAERVRDPKKNIGRASLLGTASSAILYVLSSAALMGLVPHNAVAGIVLYAFIAARRQFQGGAP